MFNLNYISPTEEENNILYRLHPAYEKYIELHVHEREFLNALVLRFTPKKALELGVSAGGSSVVIANALKEIQGSRLYSIDLDEKYYKEPDKQCGFVCDEYPDLKKIRQQYLGGFACNFLDEIGSGIDFAFIDTAHVFPGELLDFLMIYPYLSPNAAVVFHDTSLNLHLHAGTTRERSVVTGMLCSAIAGKKYQPLIDYKQVSHLSSPNITAVKITPETGERLWEVFNLLVHTWAYPISEKNLALFVGHFEKWYPKNAVDFFLRINEFQNHHYFARRKVPQHKITRFHYHAYRLLSKITLGQTRKKYKDKRKLVKQLGRF